jgi:hypothetical protein
VSCFFCVRCASPAISVPSTIDDFAAICCDRCGDPLGTWGELKDRVRRIARSAQERSCDPLAPREGLAPEPTEYRVR